MATSTSQSRLLVVDDEPCIREMMSEVLLAKGYEVLTAQDGFDALNQLKGRLPDLIIADLEMPRMTGFEFLAIVRQRFPQIPTIVVSGESFSDESPIALIADAFFSKGSYTNDQLAETIAKFIAASPGRPRPSAIDIETNWIPRDAEGYLLMKCGNCLRSFPLEASRMNGGLHKVNCPWCQANLQFKIDHRKSVFPHECNPARKDSPHL
jgi:CheY-like chemotaxis protein